MVIAGSIALMVYLGCGLYGWGGVARRVMGLPTGTWPMTVAIGLAAWIGIGGVLNLLHVAWPAAVCLLLGAGCGFVTRSLWIRYFRPGAIEPKIWEGRFYWLYLAIWLALGTIIVGFAVMTQATPGAFNFSDDYEKYFAYVARIVQTGTLAGSPLNSLGAETLGAQAFLQSLFVAYLPLAAINVADAVFCFGLTVVLAGGIALRRPALAPVALLAMLVVWLVEPQYVNVSALYSAAALMFALVTLSVDRREYAVADAGSTPAAVTGLIYAALVALKPTFALFGALHFLFSTAAGFLATRRVVATMKRALATAGWGLLFIAPWIALYSPLYWTAVTAPVAGLPSAPVPATETIDLFSTKILFYGGSYAEYTFAAAVFLICGAAMLVRRKASDPDAARFIAVCLAVPAAYLVILLAVAPLLAGYGASLRYFVPVLIGTAPAVLVLCGVVGLPSGERRRDLVPLMSAGLAAVIVIWSVPGFLSRCRLLDRTGSMLAYVRNWSPDLADKALATNRERLQPPAVSSLAQHFAEMQRQVPAGEPLLAWIETPFLLNFARNPIIDVDIAGLANPWSKTPPVSYVLWQYAGVGVRQPRDYASAMQGPGRHETYQEARGLSYAANMQKLLTRSQVVMDDGSTVLLRIGPDSGLP